MAPLRVRSLPVNPQNSRKRDPNADLTQGEQSKKEETEFVTQSQKAQPMAVDETPPPEPVPPPQPLPPTQPLPPPQPRISDDIPLIPRKEEFLFAPPRKKQKSNDTSLYATVGLAIIISLMTYMFMEKMKSKN